MRDLSRSGNIRSKQLELRAGEPLGSTYHEFTAVGGCVRACGPNKHGGTLEFNALFCDMTGHLDDEHARA